MMKKELDHNGMAKNSMTFIPVGLNIQRPNVLPPIFGLRRFYVHICLLAIFVVLVLIVRTIANVKIIFINYHTESDTDGELLILPKEYANKKSAFCLDGTPPGYYIRKGKSPHINKWIIHLPSGAWCSTEKECYERSLTDLGSSAEVPVFTPFKGILSASKVENPDFHMWTMVQFLYCDGSSFTGNRKTTITYKSKELYLRGHLIFKALVDFLLEYTELKSADQVILTGSSAGGLAALINVDFLRRKLNNVKSVHAVLDGMLFIDQPTMSGEHKMSKILKDTFYLHEAHEAESVQECISNLSVTEQWKCFDPVYFYSHVFTPVFFVSSSYDMWFIRNSLGVTCPLLSCSDDDKAHIEKYKENIMKSVKSIIFSVHDGLFLTSCPVHTMLVKPWYSSKIMVNYMTVQQAVGQWYFHRYPKNIKNIESFNYTQVLNRCPPVY